MTNSISQGSTSLVQGSTSLVLHILCPGTQLPQHLLKPLLVLRSRVALPYCPVPACRLPVQLLVDVASSSERVVPPVLLATEDTGWLLIPQVQRLRSRSSGLALKRCCPTASRSSKSSHPRSRGLSSGGGLLPTSTRSTSTSHPHTPSFLAFRAERESTV